MAKWIAVAAVAAHLFIEILLSGQVSDRRVDSAAKILKNHGDMVLLGAIREGWWLR